MNAKRRTCHGIKIRWFATRTAKKIGNIYKKIRNTKKPVLIQELTLPDSATATAGGTTAFVAVTSSAPSTTEVG